MRLRVCIISCLLVLLMVPSAGAQSMTAKEAAELVKERISVPSDVDNFTSNYFEYEGRGQWEFQWTGKKATLSAVLDVGSGDVTSMYGYGADYSGDGSLIPKVSKSQALKVAQDFLKQSAPSKYSSLKLTDRVPDPIVFVKERGYTFYFERIINGVPCAFNGAELSVSSATGKVTHCYLNWDYQSKFPVVKNPISGDKAGEVMQDKGFELMYYLPSPEVEGQEEVKLVYGIYEPRRTLIDAQSGEFVTAEWFYTLRDSGGEGGFGGMAADKARAGGAGNQLTPIEEEEVQAVANLLSKEEAQKAVLKHFQLPEGFKLDSASLFEDERKNRMWNISWNLTPADDQSSGYMSASVNAKNGEVLSYSKHIYFPGMENETKKYSVAEAKDIGEKFLKGIQPAKMAQVKSFDRSPLNESSRTIMFNYARLVNGIPFYGDSISVEVDRVTGEVSSFYVQWGNFNFPKASPAIDKDKAYAALTAVNPMEMGYLRIDSSWNNRTEQKIGMYYFLSNFQPRFVDAATGKVLLDTGKEYVSEGNAEFTDIAGSPYAEDIRLLFAMGIVGDSTGKFNPKSQLTSADFIKMLVLASGWYPGEGDALDELPDDWYRPYYQTAVYYGVLDADNLPKPDQKVNRMECARSLVIAAGLKKAAVLEGIYKVPTSDGEKIEEKDKGFAAIALKMGLLPDVNGNFAGSTVLTRGQTASIIVDYMENAVVK